ncbi:hypothetical protein Tco_0337246 [Tanacetum coccineum]
MDDDTTHDEQVQSSGDEDIGHDHIPTVNLRQNWWKPLTEDRPATPEPAWPALSISKMKAAYYPDVGLEQMVPDQMWMKKNASMTSPLCMVSLTGGSKDNDSTLTDTSEGDRRAIDEALDYQVKEFKVNRMNPGLNTQFWTRKDVDRSKEFMFAIAKNGALR